MKDHPIPTPISPCRVGCRFCRENKVCNFCGTAFWSANGQTRAGLYRCTNGRCSECCSQNCRHLTGFDSRDPWSYVGGGSE